MSSEAACMCAVNLWSAFWKERLRLPITSPWLTRRKARLRWDQHTAVTLSWWPHDWLTRLVPILELNAHTIEDQVLGKQLHTRLNYRVAAIIIAKTAGRAVWSTVGNGTEMFCFCAVCADLWTQGESPTFDFYVTKQRNWIVHVRSLLEALGPCYYSILLSQCKSCHTSVSNCRLMAVWAVNLAWRLENLTNVD